MPLGALVARSSLLFQATITAGLAVFALALHRRIREQWVLWWAAAWTLYVVRLMAMATFSGTGHLVWFYWHQVATGWTALAILWSALSFSDRIRWKSWYLVFALFPPIWGWVAAQSIDRFLLSTAPPILFLTGATIWTAWVFWRHARNARAGGARFLALSLFLWGLHHLSYFVQRRVGPEQTYFDILFELAVGVGFGLFALAEFASRLEERTAELGRLSGLMVRQHEAERRRLSRELHDETAQTLSAVKLEVGMLREGADPEEQERLDHVLALVDGGIRGIRRVMNDLRPALLDDLGLAPAIHSLAADVRERGRLEVHTVLPDSTPRLDPDVELALFRAAQEALANVVRHAEASVVQVGLAVAGDTLRLTIEDNGRGMPALSRETPEFGHLGLAGLRERIGALGGQVQVATGQRGGVTVTVDVPVVREHGPAGVSPGGGG